MSDSSDDEPLLSRQKKMKAEHSGPSNGSGKPVKQEPVSPAKPKAKPAAKSAEAKEKRVKKEVSTPAKKEKKVFDKPGQTRETPLETDSLRKFYASLIVQRPSSGIAKKWLCMHGLLSDEEAEAYLKEIGKAGIKSPSKPKAPARRSTGGAVSAPRRPPVSQQRKSAPKAKPAPKKRKADSSEDEPSDDSEDDDFEEQPVALKPKKPASKSASKPAPKKTSRDVAFEDGGLDSDSDDDKPLALRA